MRPHKSLIKSLWGVRWGCYRPRHRSSRSLTKRFKRGPQVEEPNSGRWRRDQGVVNAEYVTHDKRAWSEMHAAGARAHDRGALRHASDFRTPAPTSHRL